MFYDIGPRLEVSDSHKHCSLLQHGKKITAVKGFIVQDPGCLDFIEAFFKQFMSEVLKDWSF